MLKLFQKATNHRNAEITAFLTLSRIIPNFNVYLSVTISVFVNIIVLSNVYAAGNFNFSYDGDGPPSTLIGYFLSYIEGILGELFVFLTAIGAILARFLRFKKIAIFLILITIGMFFVI